MFTISKESHLQDLRANCKALSETVAMMRSARESLRYSIDRSHEQIASSRIVVASSPAETLRATSSNRLLQLLPKVEFDRLRTYLEPVKLNAGHVCFQPARPIDYIYFVESGLGSTCSAEHSGCTPAIGMHGFEGVIGVPVLLCATKNPHRTIMQTDARANRIPAALLRQEMDSSPTLRDILLRYAQYFLIQVGETAIANTRFGLPQRLARLILMMIDRLGPVIQITHAHLSALLGVRRAGVTDALHVLEGERLIRSGRGMLQARDRSALEARAGEAYGVPEAEYARLFGIPA
jgi:CRP-like cAMP-binding protein